MQRNGIEGLVDEVAGWGRGGVWEMDVVEQTQTTCFFKVTRCPYYEKYKELGLGEFGVGFSCCRDEPFARGFNPQQIMAAGGRGQINGNAVVRKAMRAAIAISNRGFRDNHFV